MTSDQTAAVGLIALLITQFLKIVVIGLFGVPKPSKLLMAIIAFAVATLTAYYYTGPISLPDPALDPLAFAQALAAAAGQVFAYASVFYVFLIEYFLKWLDGLTTARWLKRRFLAP